MISNYLMLFVLLVILHALHIKSFPISDKKNFFISTPGCRMIRKDPFSDEARRFYYKVDPLVCSTVPPLIESDQTSVWINHNSRILRKLPINIKCCYRELYRPSPNSYPPELKLDVRVSFNDNCTRFKERATITVEYIEVTCFAGYQQVYKDFHGFVTTKAGIVREHPEERPSVLIIGIDSLSRGNLERQMPKTVKLVRSLGAFEMFGLNKIADNTFPNVLGMFTGFSEDDLTYVCGSTSNTYLDKCPIMWDKFKSKGYVTAFIEEATELGLFVYLKQGYRQQPTDIYTNPFMRMNEDQLTGIGHDEQGGPKCSGDRGTVEVLNEFTKKIVSNLTALNKPFWVYSWSTTFSHGDWNIHPTADNMYYDLITYFYKTGIFNNTLILFMSDHGMRFGDFRFTYQGYLEERQPFAFFFVPPWISQKYPTATMNMKNNQRLLTTPYDLGATLLNILNINYLGEPYNFRKGKSIFAKIYENRTCESAYVPFTYCTCYGLIPTSNDYYIVQAAAEKLTLDINFLLRKNFHICEKFLHSKILSAKMVDQPRDSPMRDYVIIIKVWPGNGAFEATVRVDMENSISTVLGHISRINRYNNSDCINDKLLKLYCYCKKKN